MCSYFYIICICCTYFAYYIKRHIYIIHTDSAVLDAIDVKARKRRIVERSRIESLIRAAKAKVRSKTMMPRIPAKDRRRADYAMNDDQGGSYFAQAADDDITVQYKLNNTLAGFMEDSYTKQFIHECNVNVKLFLQVYLIYIAQADILTQWFYDNLTTLAIEPVILFVYLEHANIQWPASLVDRGAKYYTYKTLRYFIRAVRDDFIVNRIARHEWYDHSHEDNLWSYFKKWFLDEKLAPLIYRRAQLCESKYVFIKKQIHKLAEAGYHDFYKPTPEQLFDALSRMHKWQKGNIAAPAAGSSKRGPPPPHPDVEGDGDEVKAETMDTKESRYPPDEAYVYSEEDEDEDDVKFSRDGYKARTQPQATDPKIERVKADPPPTVASKASGKVKKAPAAPESGPSTAGLSDVILDEVDIVSVMGSVKDAGSGSSSGSGSESDFSLELVD